MIVSAAACDAGHGDAVLPLEMDVTDRAAVFEGVKRAGEHFGRLDVIVNNAGHAQVGAIEELTYHASKWALEGLNEALAAEVAEFGVKVTIIEPGGFATRGDKNPDPLDNGHMVRTDPAYDDLRRRLAAFASKQPAGDPAAAAHGAGRTG